MIVRRNRSWWRKLFAMRGTSLQRTMPRIVFFTLFSVAITVFELWMEIETYSLTVAPFALIGVALSIFLGFRNNAAYDRYWEGRKLWGGLVNVTRSLARQTTNLVVSAERPLEVADFHQEMVYRTIAYAHCLRHHLRDSDPLVDLADLLPADDLQKLSSQKNVPLYVLRRMGERLRYAWQQGWIDRCHIGIAEGSLSNLTDIQGACERIRNTPIPFAYSVLIHRIVAFYCFALPFGIFSTVGVLTPVVVFLISHAFPGLEEIGDEIEDPFGTGAEQLPLTALCRTIEVNLRQHLDEHSLPEMLQPVDDVLV